MVRPAVRELVRERAGRRCKYCRAPEQVTGGRYQVDHILPKSLGGGDEVGNLAFGCSSCNLAKCNHMSGLDPETQEQTALFYPRKDRLEEHFAFARASFELHGKTAKGRATVAQLKMNIAYQVEARKLWVEL